MFPTTHRSLVVALANGGPEERARAFETLLAVYWKPVYKYLRVGWRLNREDAEDSTQSFFTRAFERETLASYQPEKASFRGFLRLLLDRHAHLLLGQAHPELSPHGVVPLHPRDEDLARLCVRQ